MSYIVGLTGQTGAGKTTAAELFEKNGFGVVNCDSLAHRVIAAPPCLTELAAAFSDILDPNGSLDRSRLSKIVFADKAALFQLNSITHPHILRALNEQISQLSKDHRVLVLDAPTLFESGADALCDMIVSVVCETEILIKRIMKRDALTEAEAANRISSQQTADFFRSRSRFAIENNGDLPSLCEQTNFVIRKIKEQTDGS